MKNHSDTLPIMRTTKLQDHTPRSIPSATPIERTTKLRDLTTEDLMDIIHAATHKDNQDKKHQATTSMTPRTSVDVYYVACSTYYHFWRNCDFLAKLLKSLDFLNNLDPAKKKVVMETFHTKQQWHRQHKQTNAVARAATYLENNDISSMYALIQEMNEEPANYDPIMKQDPDQEWQWHLGEEYHQQPDPAPYWDTADIIWTIINDGTTINKTTPVDIPETHHLAYIGLTSDYNMDTPQSPYSIHYYTQGSTSPPPNTTTTRHVHSSQWWCQLINNRQQEPTVKISNNGTIQHQWYT